MPLMQCPDCITENQDYWEPLLCSQMYGGLIADGQHICSTMIQLLLRAGCYEQGVFFSDALAPLGLPDGIYPWDKRQIIVKNGTARLPDGTLDDTALLVGAQNLVRWGTCEVGSAIALPSHPDKRSASQD